MHEAAVLEAEGEAMALSNNPLIRRQLAMPIHHEADL